MSVPGVTELVNLHSWVIHERPRSQKMHEYGGLSIGNLQGLGSPKESTLFYLIN